MKVLGILEVNQSHALYRHSSRAHVNPDHSFIVEHKFHTNVYVKAVFIPSYLPKPFSLLQGMMARNS